MQPIPFPKPLLHLFVCTNERPFDHPTPCCGRRVTGEDVKQLKEWIKQQGLTSQVYCSRAGCLGFCNKDASVAVVYPEGQFFKYNSTEELKELIKKKLSALAYRQ